jgi:hypothetical protein
MRTSSPRAVRRPVLLALGAVILGITACGPSVQESAEDFLPPFCQKLRTCNEKGFDAAYASIDACVQKGLSAIPEGDRNKRSKCGDSEIDACRKDIEAAECSTLATGSSSSLPASCQGC